MKMFNKFQSSLGYQVTDNQIDTFGVDHSNFSARDEVEYQFARQNKENQLIQNYNNQGITKNYPRYGTNFWGNPDNNYGFGSSNIHDNIENRENQTEKSYGFGSETQTFEQESNNSTQWGLNSTPLAQNSNLFEQRSNNNIYDNIMRSNIQNEIDKQKKSYNLNQLGNKANLILDTIKYTGENLGELAADAQIAYQHYNKMNNVGKQLVKKYGPNQADGIDNYYHALLQCKLAQISPTSKDWGLRMGYGKEIYDYYKKKGNMPMQTIISDSRKDLKNNLYGSNLGYNNPYKNCEDMLDEFRTENMRKENIR